LLSLLVGGVGVAQVARAWLSSRMDDIAIMRCLGARPREVILLYLGQVLLLALIASVAGAVLATMLHWLVPKLTGGLLPAELIHPWQPHAIMRGICLGVAVAILFTFPLLVGLRKVPPVRVLRRDAEPVRAGVVRTDRRRDLHPRRRLGGSDFAGGIAQARHLVRRRIGRDDCFTRAGRDGDQPRRTADPATIDRRPPAPWFDAPRAAGRGDGGGDRGDGIGRDVCLPRRAWSSDT
jgi:hypothetical protein